MSVSENPMIKRNYKVIRGIGQERFENNVNKAMEQGGIFVGGVHFSRTPNGGALFLQAMIFPIKEEICASD